MTLEAVTAGKGFIAAPGGLEEIAAPAVRPGSITLAERMDSMMDHPCRLAREASGIAEIVH